MDSLYVVGASEGTMRFIPLDSVAGYEVREFSPGRSVALVAGVVVFAAVAWGALILAACSSGACE